ncbi:redoxin domain-containing protein [Desulforhopalus sp. IMCC35007]|nr:redoxin domain-containing protein [Desulforhopalus sp. IMCC35007]
MEALQEIYSQVLDLGGSLIAISPQLPKYTKQVVKKHNLSFPVLADIDNNYADKLGLVFTLSEKLKELYSKFGIDLPRFNGNDTWQLPMSGRFLVDSNGIIRNVDVHPDHTTRPEPDEILEFMQSLA